MSSEQSDPVSAAFSAFRDALEKLVKAEFAAQTAQAPAFEWVSCVELGLDSRTASRLAKRENLRTTRIGKRIYLSRADVAALAERKRLPKIDERDEDDEDDEDE